MLHPSYPTIDPLTQCDTNVPAGGWYLVMNGNQGWVSQQQAHCMNIRPHYRDVERIEYPVVAKNIFTVGESVNVPRSAPFSFGGGDASCYGAKPTNDCKTCDDVVNAYKAKGWKYDTSLFAQCKNGNAASSSASPAPAASKTQSAFANFRRFKKKK